MNSTERALFVTSRPVAPYGRGSVAASEGRFLDLSDSDQEVELPAGWERVRASELFDADEFRKNLMRFLEGWPTSVRQDGKTFGELFRLEGEYSLWWTQVASRRNPRVGFVPLLRKLSIFDRALTAIVPQRVVLNIDNRKLVSGMVSRCGASGIDCELGPDCARPAAALQWGDWRWLAGALQRLVTMPARLAIRSLLARGVTGGRGRKRVDEASPAIVFSSRNSSYAREEGADHRFVVWFWNEISAALRRRRPGWRQFFLQKLGSRPESGWKYGELYHTGWPLQRRLDDAAPLPDRFPALGAWCRALPRQLAALRRYRRLELSEGFRSTFRFAGADVSSLIVPELRNAVAKMAEWERGAAARVEALRSIGNVAAMVVAEEFYPTAMQDLAAARELGIPTIGAQHGTIMPTHLVYTVPRGQVEHAPVPDFFAAFSEYAKETVSEIGSYPAERVWVTGSPRFDYLVNTPPDRSQARRMLNLPADKRIILVANQTFAWFPRVVEATIAWARDREDCLVCVKTHPKRLAMRAGEFQRMAARLGADNVLCYEDRFAELLAACDVLISGSSTTVLEAALLGRGTICVNFSDEPDWYPYVADGGALRAKSESELALRLAELLEGDADAQERIVTGRMEFLRRHAGPAGEGRAAEELADRIEALIEGRVPALPVVRQKEAAEPALCG